MLLGLLGYEHAGARTTDHPMVDGLSSPSIQGNDRIVDEPARDTSLLPTCLRPEWGLLRPYYSPVLSGRFTQTTKR